MLLRFSQGSIPESLVKKFQNWPSYSTFVETIYFFHSLGVSSYFQQKLITLSVLNFFPPKLSGIDPYDKQINNQMGMPDDMRLWLVAYLKQWPFM